MYYTGNDKVNNDTAALKSSEIPRYRSAFNKADVPTKGASVSPYQNNDTATLKNSEIPRYRSAFNKADVPTKGASVNPYRNNDPKFCNVDLDKFVKTNNTPKVTMLPVKSDSEDNIYSNIKEMIRVRVITPSIAANMVTAEIRHRAVIATHLNDPKYAIDMREDLEKYIFNDFAQMIFLHIDTFMRYTASNVKERYYYTIYDAVKMLVDRGNEVCDFDIDCDIIKKELDKFYEIFR